MLRCTNIEPVCGIEVYGSRFSGVSGIIKKVPEDFTVSEILDGGLDAQRLWQMPLLPMEISRYSLWILKKTNWETFEAISELSRSLQTRPLRTRICGIKDRRAVTYQFVAVPLTVVSPALEHITLRRGEARRMGYIDGLDSSRLIGNRFEVLVRGARSDGRSLEEFVAAVEEGGIPNFYGHQRFGLIRPVTHLVGRSIVKGDIQAAVETFIGYTTEFEPEAVGAARRYFAESRDPSEALRIFPKSLIYERRMLRYLNKRPGDYAGALRRLPLRLRRLFIDAYSSYLFNKTLSLTLRDGLKVDEPIVGDLFMRLDRYRRPYGRPLQVTGSNVEEVGVRISRGEAALILPRPGFGSWIPRGPRGEVLKGLLEEEGVSLKSFRVRALPECSSRGSYRPIALKPLTLSIKEPDSETIRLSFTLPPSGYATILLREFMKRRCALAYIGVEHCYA